MAQSHSPWLGPAAFLNPLGTFASLLLLTLFPNGRFVPRWTRWLVIGFVAIRGLLLFLPTSTLVSFLLGTWLFFGVALLLVLAQIYIRFCSAGALIEVGSGKRAVPCSLPIFLTHRLARFDGSVFVVVAA